MSLEVAPTARKHRENKMEMLNPHCGIDRDFRKGAKPSDHAPLLLELAD